MIDVITFPDNEDDFGLWIGPYDFHYPAIEPHVHEFWELVIVEVGQGRHLVGDLDYPIGRGDVFVVNQTIVHGFRDAVDLRVRNILFKPEIMLKFRTELSHLPGFHALFFFEPLYRQRTQFAHRLTLPPEAMNEAMGIVRAMQREFDERRRGYQSMVTAMFQQLVTQLARAYDLREEARNEPMRRLATLTAWMQEHLAEPMELDALARRARLSPNHLIRVFKQATGHSPLQYLTRLRLEAACRLMETDRTISEIAFSVGFNDSNYFTRQFRQVYGITPTGMRRRLRAGR